MINRRYFLTIAAFAAMVPLSVRAQAADKAAAFVKSTGDRLVAVVNGPGSTSAKRSQMTQIINSDVDVEGIGRFAWGATGSWQRRSSRSSTWRCSTRFW